MGTEPELKIITKEVLYSWNACGPCIRWFVSQFPKGADPTVVYEKLITEWGFGTEGIFPTWLGEQIIEKVPQDIQEQLFIKKEEQMEKRAEKIIDGIVNNYFVELGKIYLNANKEERKEILKKEPGLIPYGRKVLNIMFGCYE